MKIDEFSVPFETMLLARLVDCASWLVWSKTEDGQKGKNHPTSIVEKLTGKKEDKEENITFMTGDDFMNYRNRLIGGQ